MATLLVIEDDINTNEAICEYMKPAGHTILSALDGEEGLLLAKEPSIDLVVLDIMLPKIDGMTVLRELRKCSTVPILMLTAIEDEHTQATSFDAEADDYITKPFSVNELLARISAHLRREQRSHNKTKSKFSEDLIIDYSDRSLYIKGHKIELSNKEFEIIQLLSSNAGQVFDREKIYENIWGIDGNGDSVVIKEHIRKIRLKFNEFTDKGYITTVWGVGYKWEK